MKNKPRQADKAAAGGSSSRAFQWPRGLKQKYGGPAHHPSDVGYDWAAAMEWKTEPDSCLVPSSDSNSESERITVKMPPQMLAALSAVRDSPNSPYTSVQQVILHALHRHLLYYAQVNPYMNPSFLSVLKFHVALGRERDMLDKADEAVKLIGRQLRELVDGGELDEARYRLWQLTEDIKSLDDGPSRRRAMKWLQEEFGHIVPEERPLS